MAKKPTNAQSAHDQVDRRELHRLVENDMANGCFLGEQLDLLAKQKVGRKLAPSESEKLEALKQDILGHIAVCDLCKDYLTYQMRDLADKTRKAAAPEGVAAAG